MLKIENDSQQSEVIWARNWRTTLAEGLMNFLTNGNKNLSTNQAQEVLFQLITRASSGSDWLSNYVAIAELDRINSTTFSRVMKHEASRLLGYLEFVGWNHSVSLTDIIDVLGTEYSSHLIVDYVMAGRLKDESELKIAQQISDSNEDVQRALLTFALGNEVSDFVDSTSIKKINVLSVRKFLNEENATLFVDYEVMVPPLNLAGSLLPENDFSFRSKIDDCRIVVIPNAKTFGESELILTRDGYFADSLVREDAKAADCRADSMILAIDGEDAFIRTELFDKSIEFDDAIWACYPISQAWGHWFSVVMTRLAVAYQNIEREMTVIISDKVPQSFVDIAQLVFPLYRFSPIAYGEVCLIKRLYCIPSRMASHLQYQMNWSVDGDFQNLWCEPQTMGLLRKTIDRLQINSESPRAVYMNRRGAQYRISSADYVLELLAERRGLVSVDMSTLSAIEQIAIAKNSDLIAGLCGSHWAFPAALAKEGMQSVMVHHDRPWEWRGLAWTLGEFSGKPPHFVCGRRPTETFGYGMKSYHQPVILNESEYKVFDELITDNF